MKIFFILFILPLTCYGQIDSSIYKRIQRIENHEFKAGLQLQRYSTNMGYGIGFEILGGVIIGAGGSNTTTIIGSCIGVAGLFLQVSAITNIANAGKYLQGNKIVIPLKQRVTMDGGRILKNE